MERGQDPTVTAVGTTVGTVAESHVLPSLVGEHMFNTHFKPEGVVARTPYDTKSIYGFLNKSGIVPSITRYKPRAKVRKRQLESGFQI